MTRVVLAFVAGLTVFLSGCSPIGVVYTHVVQPLSTDFHETPVVEEAAQGDVKEVAYYVRVVWNSNGIGAIAKEHGFAKVHYADLETLSVLGYWTQEFVHIYGTRLE